MTDTRRSYLLVKMKATLLLYCSGDAVITSPVTLDHCSGDAVITSPVTLDHCSGDAVITSPVTLDRQPNDLLNISTIVKKYRLLQFTSK